MIIHILVYAVQLFGILVPFAGCVVLLKRAKSNSAMYLLLANLGCLIINGGYMLLLLAKTYEGAHIALKMEYFGNIVFYLTFVLFLWTYLRMKRYKWAMVGIYIWAVVDVLFYFCIWMGDGFGLAFQKLDFVWNPMTGLVMTRLTPGILYFLHYCIVCMVGFCGMIYTTVRMFLVQLPAERNNLAKLAGAQFVITASLALMLWFNFPFDIVPICASLSILCIIISIRRNEFFGIAELGQQWVFEQMEDAFVILDEMYGYLDSNAYAKKIFPELNHKHKNEMVSGELCHLCMDADKIQNIQGKYYHKKVMEMWENGRLTGYSLLLVDITEQQELTERVKQEKERADAANQAKSAFVSNVSHEIRTPMNAIVGMTQIMLRKDDLPKQDKEYLMNIQNSGNALLTIVNDLLDMSKIESGKMELVDEEYDFMSMLRDLAMIILNRIGSKPVELLYDIDPDIPAKLYGDALRIRQIIINLMNNATKFTEKGYVCLTVKVNKIEQSDMELFISVKDTGQGIREEDISKLFGSFQQVDAKKNHHKEGTGLGLSISKQLVELMGGSIGVSSEYGKGSEFYFTIHQQIVDGNRAAQIADDRQAVIIGGMESEAANEMLRKLVDKYGLTYAYAESMLGDMQPDTKSGIRAGITSDVQPDIRAEDMSDAQPERLEITTDMLSQPVLIQNTDTPIYYFTDDYGRLSDIEKQRLLDLNVIICVMQNPMEENDLPEDILTMNKPIYSYNFCNLIEERQDSDEDRTIGSSEEKGPEPDITDFVAPEANVLIVDDNEINCMVAEELLKPLQMQIDLAADGKQAVDMIQKKKYDLVFMDHLMPVMDGIEAVKALRQMDGEYYKMLPVIALTGNTAKEQQEEYIRAGMSDYLSKPLDMVDICRKIRKWIPDKINNGNA